MTASPSSRFESLPDSPFPRLNALIEGIEPGKPPLVMSLGEPQHPFPKFVMEEISRNSALFGKYPPIIGTAEFRNAAAGWLGLKKGFKGDKTAQAAEVGKQLAAAAKKAGIESAVFDRGGYLYHGRVKALAEGAREGGLKF